MCTQSTIAEFVAFPTVINETIGQADRQPFLDRLLCGVNEMVRRLIHLG
jgi:hypothetical protein